MAASSTENILFLDIETVPQTYSYAELDENTKVLWDKKWAFNKDISGEEQYAKAGIYAEFAKIICIGLAYYKNGRLQIEAISSHNEGDILIKFIQFLNTDFNAANTFLCAHNGKEFDFPFICRRLLINQLQIPALLNIQGQKPWEIRHLDTMELWKFGDYKNFTSLNLLAHVFGIPSPKDEIDGSQVAKVYYEEDGLEKVKQYCIKDVITLVHVFNRLTGRPAVSDSQINIF
jgi:3'-5' exonuclease